MPNPLTARTDGPPFLNKLMLVRSVGIKNFRSCKDVEVDMDQLTAIVGANGSGKSAVLHALELFYAPSPHFEPGDFYAHDTTLDIEITVSFIELSDDERQRFRAYLDGHCLTVTRVLAWRDGRGVHRLHGERRGFAGFLEIRKSKASEARKLYAQLPQLKTGELPAWTNFTDVLQALDVWEESHLDECTRARDDGAFFGFKEVGQGYLGRCTRLIFIPAVRDAATDAQDGKGSVIADLMDMVVRRTVAENKQYLSLLEETQKKYREVFEPAKFEEIGRLSGRLTSTLRTYVPDAAVAISWDEREVDLPLPRASVRLAEDGFVTSVGSCGHGLQRAFILTLLQHLAAAQPGQQEDELVEGGVAQGQGGETTEPIPDLVLVIEEPELFQHPSRQRHFASVLKQLAGQRIPGVTQRAQVMYCTHSPHFVGLDRFDQIRIFRKVAGETGRPKVTVAHRTSFDEIAVRVTVATGEHTGALTGAAFRARLSALITPSTSEGFFADVAVLVEGESDRAALIGAGESLNVQLESAGVAVIPCTGKSNVLNLAAVYQAFGIATYCVWDGDGDKAPTEGICGSCARPLDNRPDPVENHRLLRLHGAAPLDNPPLQVAERFACFETDLEKTLKVEIGEPLFSDLLDAVKAEHGLAKRKHAMKNPWVLAEVLRRAREQGAGSSSVESMIERILALRGGSATPGLTQEIEAVA